MNRTIGVGPYVNAYQPPRQSTTWGIPSAAKLRCENGLIDQALFHGFATAMTNIKGQVATGIVAVKGYAPAIGITGEAAAGAAGAAAETAAAVGATLSGAAEAGSSLAAVWVVGSGGYDAFKYYQENDDRCSNIQ